MPAGYVWCQNSCLNDELCHFASDAITNRSRLKQDIAIHCLSLDRARSRDKQWDQRRQRTALISGPGAVQKRVHEGRAGVVVVAGEVRRRSRQAVPRPKVVQFSLTEEEFEEVSAAASRSGKARGAFAAEVTLAAVRETRAPVTVESPLREVLTELMTAAGLVRRV